MSNTPYTVKQTPYEESRSCPHCGKILDFSVREYDLPCDCGAIYYGWGEGQSYVERKISREMSDLKMTEAPRQFPDAYVERTKVNGAWVYTVHGKIECWEEYWLVPAKT